MKRLFLISLFAFGVQAAKVDEVDVLVINASQLGLPKSSIEFRVKRDLELGNIIFAKNGLHIYRRASDFHYLDSDLKFSNLQLEGAALATRDMAGLFNGVAFADIKLQKEVSGWLAKNPERYKVIYLPLLREQLSCGMTFNADKDSFSVLYFSESGTCSSSWILAHELGHQDGLNHEGLKFGGGLCGREPSLMHSGVHGSRSVIYGHPDLCAVALPPLKRGESPRTPYELYKSRSDNNRKKHYAVASQLVVPQQPVVIAENYIVDGMDLLVSLSIYNPTERAYFGALRLIDWQAVPDDVRRAHKVKDGLMVNPKSVQHFKYKIPRDKLFGVGSKLMVQSDINWSARR